MSAGWKTKLQETLYLVTEDWYFVSHSLELAEMTKNKGYNVTVATRISDHAEVIRSKGLALYPLSISRSIQSPLRELSTIISLIKLYRDIKPNLVHHISLKPMFLGSVAAWIARVPLVINTYTGLGYIVTSNSLVSKIFMYLVTPLVSLIIKGEKFHSIIQNVDDKKLLLKLGLVNANHLNLIRGSGVDVNQYSKSIEPISDKPIVLFPSRLLKDKGIIEFIDASKILYEKQIKARFVIAGKIDDENPTSIKYSELKSWIDSGIIEWCGYREDMDEVFKQVHVICLPSYREGLPKSLLEAASSGRPIVTTDVPGCREVVIDGVNGYLVPVKDPVSLAEAINRLLESAVLRKQRGEEGRRLVEEHFDIDRINSATIDLYKKLLPC